MATIFRVDYLGAIHHVFVRGNDKRDIFGDDSDRIFLLDRLKRLKAETDFKLYAFCLMTNHLHFLIETGKAMLDAVMGRLLSVYAARFHRRHGSVGHLFQGPYGAKLCARDAYFIRLVRYIHRNPVKAGICLDPAQWSWSGHRQLAFGEGGLLDEEFPLSFFGDDLPAARSEYARFSGLPDDDQDSYFVTDSPVVAPRNELAAIASEVAAQFSVRTEVLASGGYQRGQSEIRLAFLEKAILNGHRQADVARFLGISSAALTRLKRREG